MKILMFGMSSYPGGIENFILNLFIESDFAKDNKVDFVVYEESVAYFDEIKKAGFNVFFVPHLKKHPLLYRKAVKNIIKKGGYDAIYVHNLTSANSYPNRLAKRYGIKAIVHSHANSTIKGKVRRILHKLNKKFVAKNATLRLACSENAGRWLFCGKNYEYPFTVIKNAVSADRFKFSDDKRKVIREKYKISDGDFLLGSVGRLAEEKNNPFMVEILSEMIKKGVNAKLLLVGDGVKKQEILDTAERLKVKDNLILYGNSSTPEDVYPAFDAFLFPSSFEGFGIAGLEAQVAGLKVFASDCLSKELNVGGNVCYLPLSSGAGFWADKIIESDCKNEDRFTSYEKIKNSPYEKENQAKLLKEIIENA